MQDGAVLKGRKLKKKMFFLNPYLYGVERDAGTLVCTPVGSACAAVSQRVHSLSVCQSVSWPFFSLLGILTSFSPLCFSTFVSQFVWQKGRPLLWVLICVNNPLTKTLRDRLMI